MGLFKYLYFEGRVSRRVFWIVVWPVPIFILVTITSYFFPTVLPDIFTPLYNRLLGLFEQLVPGGQQFYADWLTFLPLVFLALLRMYNYLIIVTVCKRLHDRNKSGWWQILMFIPLILTVIFHFLTKQQMPVPYHIVITSGQGATVIAIIAFLWLIVELGFYRGTVGQNRFGDDPLLSRIF